MTGICCQPGGARRLDDPMAVNDCPVLTDEDRLADAELFDAGANPRDLRGFRPANATRRLAQLVDRHVGHRQLRQQVVAPLRGVIGDPGERALALAASARLCFQFRREAVGRSDRRLCGGISRSTSAASSSRSPEHAVRKGRGDHPTEERNLGLEAVNPTPWAAISHLRAPEHPSLLALELPARLDDRSTQSATAIYACICATEMPGQGL